MFLPVLCMVRDFRASRIGRQEMQGVRVMVWVRPVSDLIRRTLGRRGNSLGDLGEFVISSPNPPGTGELMKKNTTTVYSTVSSREHES